MISNILTILSFVVLLLSSLIDCNFLSRLLGVGNKNVFVYITLGYYSREFFIRKNELKKILRDSAIKGIDICFN